MDEQKDILYKLQHIDARIIHFLIALLILIPLINPIGLPLQISDGTRAAYDAIDAIPPGAMVLLAYEVAASSEAELVPTGVAWMHHLMAKGCKIVTFAIYNQEGPVYAQRIFDTVGKEYNYEYGVDYMIMGFTAGQETAVAAIGRDFRSVFEQDFLGNVTADLPLMQAIVDFNSFDILLQISNWGPDVFVRQMVQVYGIPMVACCTGIVAPGAQAYMSSGQIQGLVGALAGAAEYEILLKRPGTAAAAMDAQSTTHALVVVLVLIGNVAFFMSRSRTKGGN